MVLTYSYDEIKLGKYLDFAIQLTNEPDNVSKALAMALEMDYDSYMLLPQGHSSEQALQYLTVPLSPNENPEFIFTYENTEYMFFSDLSHLTLGQYIDFENQLLKYKDNVEHNIDLILAALLTIKDMDYAKCIKILTLDKARNIVRQMPTQQAYDLLFFFYQSKRNYQNGLDTSLAAKVDQIITEHLNQLTTLEDMGGQMWSTNSLKVKYLNMMKFINYLAQTYSLNVIAAWKNHLLKLLKPQISQNTYNNLKNVLNNIKQDSNEKIPNFNEEYKKFITYDNEKSKNHV
jgi:hypothetical protein